MNALLCLASLALAQEAENITRIYALSGLVPDGYEGEMEHPDSLFPYFDPRAYEYESSVWGESDEGVDSEVVVEYLTSVWGDEFEYEGRSVEISPRELLVVRGPEALHARVERLLSFLDGVWNAQVELTVDVVSLPDPGDSGPDAVMMPASEASAWIESARQGAAHRQYRLRMRADRPTTIDAAQDRPVIVSYRPEVAQQTFAHRPVVALASFGTRLSARAVPANGGLLLALSFLRGELIGGIRNRKVSSSGMIATGDEVVWEQAPGLYQDFDLLNRSLMLNTFLPDGQALVVRTSIGAGDGAGEVIILRQTAGGLPRLARLPLGEGGRELILANLTAVDPPRFVAEGALISSSAVLTRMRALWFEGQLVMPMLVSHLRLGDRDFANNVVAASCEELQVLVDSAWTAIVPGTFGQPRDLLAAQERALRAIEGLLRPHALLDLSIAVRRPGSGTPVRARLPLRPGESCCLALGTESLELPDFDIENAGGSTMATDIAHSVLDGLALCMRPLPTPDGGLTLELRGGASLLEGAQELELGSQLFDPVDQSSHDHLFLNERIHFAAADPKPWRAVFGNASDRGGEGALQIEIVVR